MKSPSITPHLARVLAHLADGADRVGAVHRVKRSQARRIVAARRNGLRRAQDARTAS